ncbi:MAG: tetratricopeptide repeat protein [Flavobacteriales bacterium]|nr:tetratricopeptide repeat protein [Flavobacteriales bacterium]
MFISYLRWLDGKRWPWLVAAHVAFLLACASKAMAVAFVPCLLLIDQLKERPLNTWRPWLEKSGFAVVAMVFGILAIDAQQSVKTIGNVELDGLQRVWVGGANLIVYIAQQLVPAGLNARYPYPLKAGHLPEWYPWAAVLAMGLLFLLVRALRKPNLLVFALGFMILNLLLVLQWLPVGQAIRADRYTYAAGIGWSLALAIGLEYLVRWAPRYKTAVWATALVVLSAACAWIAHERTEVWRTAVSVRSDMIAYDPRYFVYYMDRAVSFENAGDHDAALKDFDKAVKLRPANDYKPYFERGMFRLRRGAYREAMPDLITTFQQVPGHPGLVPSMIYIQWKLGLCHEVEPNATQALRLDPRSPDLLNLRGICRLQNGQPDSAWADAKRSIAVAPRKPETLVLAAAALSALHHEESACVALRIAGDKPIPDTTLDSLRTVLSDRCPSITKSREQRQP